MSYSPGALRITGIGTGLLVGDDVHIEVYQEDGTWLRLTNVLGMDIRFHPNEPVVAATELLVSEIDLTGIDVAQVATRWERLRDWFLSPFAPVV